MDGSTSLLNATGMRVGIIMFDCNDKCPNLVIISHGEKECIVDWDTLEYQSFTKRTRKAKECERNRISLEVAS